MWACRCVLGTQGTAMVLIHATISFCVAQFRSQFLSWLCSLSLLSTLRLQDVEEVKVRVSVFFFFIPMGGRKPVFQCQYPGICLCFRMSIQELGWGSPSWPQRVLHPAILCIWLCLSPPDWGTNILQPWEAVQGPPCTFSLSLGQHGWCQTSQEQKEKKAIIPLLFSR